MTNEEIYHEALRKIVATATSPVGSECVVIADLALAMGALSDQQDSTPREGLRAWVIERMVETNGYLQDALIADTNGDRCEDELKSAQTTLLRTMAAL